MNMTMSTTSNSVDTCKVAAIVTGIVLLAGVTAACTYAWFTHRKKLAIDPLEEADRRIDELENSLHRLHNTFTEAVGI